MKSALLISALVCGPGYDTPKGLVGNAVQPGVPTSPSLNFALTPGDPSRPPSIARLDISPSVDGVSVSPTFEYSGVDATASAWPPYTYGDGLNLAGSGTAPTTSSLSPLLGSDDASVLFGAGKAY